MSTASACWIRVFRCSITISITYLPTLNLPDCSGWLKVVTGGVANTLPDGISTH